MHIIRIAFAALAAFAIALVVSSALTLANGVVGALPGAHAADASDPSHATLSDPSVFRVVPLPGARIRVTMSDGYRVTLTPCRYEDGKRCFWQADTMGNGKGVSFVVVRGLIYYVALLPSDNR